MYWKEQNYLEEYCDFCQDSDRRDRGIAIDSHDGCRATYLTNLTSDKKHYIIRFALIGRLLSAEFISFLRLVKIRNSSAISKCF